MWQMIVIHNIILSEVFGVFLNLIDFWFKLTELHN